MKFDYIDNQNLPANVRYAMARSDVQESTSLDNTQKEDLLMQVGHALKGTFVPKGEQFKYPTFVFEDGKSAIFMAVKKKVQEPKVKSQIQLQLEAIFGQPTQVQA